LDGTDCHAAREIPATTVDIRLVPFEFGGTPAAAIICLPGPVDLDQRPFPTAADISKLAETVGAAVGLSRPIGTAAIIHIEKKRVTTRFQREEFRQHRIRNKPSKPPTCSPYRRFGDKFAFILGKSAASSQLIGTALITSLEKVPILQVFEAFDSQSELLDNSNQLILFGL